MIRLRLYAKLTIVITILLVSAISILSLFLISHEKAIIYRELKNRGLALANNLAYNSEYGVLTANAVILTRLIAGITAQPDVAYCVIRDINGNVLAFSGLGDRLSLPDNIVAKSVKTEASIVQPFGIAGDNGYQRYYDISVPVKSKAGELNTNEDIFFPEQGRGQERKIGVAQVGLSLFRVDTLVKKVTMNIMFMVGVMLLIAGMISVLLTRLILAPVKRLMEATQKISAGDLNFKVLVRTSDEIGVLADSFNKMVDDLQKITVSRDMLSKEVASRKRAEEELKTAYERLKMIQFQLVQSAKMASIGQLAGGVAHEINNPLTGVLNNVQLIKMEVELKKEFNLEDFKVLLGVIEESALRCKKITESLLSFSRAATGKFIPVSFNDLVEKVVTVITYEMKLQNITIQTELQPDLPQVFGDPQLLQQIIFDLISNSKWAIEKKTQKSGGTITIKTSLNPDGKRIFISVSDTGIGIPKENLERVFEPFFTTKPVGEGTGLGLSISYSIVKQHSGDIKVESQPGEGATFKITLPVDEKSESRSKI